MANYKHPKVKSEVGKVIVTMLVELGFPQHRIASLFDENAGRVAEALAERRNIKDFLRAESDT